MTGAPTSNFDFALDAQRRGLLVYPLLPNSDEPAFPEADCFATRYESQIEEWWQEDPERNIGIATDNLLALRVKTASGATALGDLLRSHQETTRTARIILDGAGREQENCILFSVPKGASVQARSNIAPGVDVLGFDDVILGPGSVLNGTRCVFANESPAAPAPQWLMDVCGVELPVESKIMNVVALKKEVAVAPVTAKTKLDWALEASQHVPVHPCRWYVDPGPDATPEQREKAIKAAKAPLVHDWPNRASQDPDQIRRWWGQWPDANIGGVTNQLLVLDVDKRHGGCETFEFLRLVEDFPETMTSNTQGGGQHLFYVLRVGEPLKNGTHRLGPGIDVKTDGGYVLMPGSTIEGRMYTRANSAPITFAPGWIVEQCKNAKPKSSAAGKRIVEEDEISLQLAANYLEKYAPRATTGNIDNTTFEVMARLYDFACSQETVHELALGWNETHCDPPGDIDRLAVVVESAGRNRERAIGCSHPLAPGFEAVEIDETKAPSIAASLPTQAPSTGNEPTDLWVENSKPALLPSQVLPDLVDSAARDRGRRLGVEPGAPAAALVTVLGSLVPAGNRLQMRQHDTEWTVKPIQWTAIIGPPGSNKSATIGYAVSAVQKLEAGWRKSFASAERNWKTAEARRAATVKSKSENPDQIFTDEQEKPRFRQKLFNDATTEALAVALSENPEGLLYHADELAGWLGSMDAYRAKGGKDRPFWLQAKEGGPLTINRKTSERICVENCAISVLGGIQPDKIRALKLGMSDDGLLQRFAPVIIQRNGNGLDIPPDATTSERLAIAATGITESENDILYRFSPEADAELHSIEAFKAGEIARPDSSPMLRQWLDKMPNEFGRLSLIFHFIEWYASDLSADIGGGPAGFISKGTAARARRYLTEFVYPHARTFYLRELGTSEVDEHALWIAGFVLSRGLKTIKTRDIYRSYPALRAQEQRSQIATTMRVLEMYDWVRPIKERKGVDEEWAINPAVHDGRFAETAELERSRRGCVRETIQREAEARRLVQAG
ncbi:hypothetical protein ABIE85_002610 [Bradyrhizobium diazoefficiens]|uniref:bifunctional DNA primase/polymerase n=1 Tax=Bradyrhizobium diazoefficiens TaxID=1355477 RepID=UPI00348608BE